MLINFISPLLFPFNSFAFKTYLPAPTLLSPSNNSNVSTLTPALSWNSVSNATSYSLQASTSSNFSTFAINQTGITQTSYTIASGTLSNNTTYYWRVNAKSSYEMSPYSSVWNFKTQANPPSAPILSSPSNGSTITTLTPALLWNSSTNATSYNLQVSTSSSFSALIINQTGLTQTSYTIPQNTLSDNTTYYWRVSATNQYGTSSYSSIYSFITSILPQPPTLISPSNSSTINTLTPELSWNTSSAATSYNLQLSNSNTFLVLLINQTGITEIETGEEPGIPPKVYYIINSGLLSNNTTYYWRVSATNQYGTSSYSSIWSFTVSMLPPSTPGLLSPANNSTVSTLTPTLYWISSSTATSYSLVVSDSSNFTSSILTQTGITQTSYTIPSGILLDNTTYYWAVSAVNQYGGSAYSYSYSFTTQVANIPSVPSLLSPSNTSVISTSTPTLSWNPSTNVTSYNLQVSTYSSFSVLLINQTGITQTSYTIPFGYLYDNTTYYWRVSATNQYGTSSYSSIWSFKTPADGIPSTPTLLSPSNGLTITTLTPTLSWSPSFSTTSYNLQVSTRNDFSYDLVLDLKGITSTSYPVSPGKLNSNTVYYWRVCAANSSMTSSYSQIWSFKTPSLFVSTQDATSIDNTSATLNGYLESLGGNSSVDVYFKYGTSLENLSYTTPLIQKTAASSFSQTITGLLANTTYYFKAVAQKGGSLSSSDGETLSFITASSISSPQAPTFLFPDSGSMITDSSPTLSWNSVSGATSYTIQISRKRDFSLCVLSDITASTQYTANANLFIDSITYYFRVRANTQYTSSASSSSNWFVRVSSQDTWFMETGNHPAFKFIKNGDGTTHLKDIYTPLRENEQTGIGNDFAAITANFNQPRDGTRHHRGVDFRTVKNGLARSIFNIYEGIVKRAAYDTLYGNYVLVEHLYQSNSWAKWQTIYAHFEDISGSLGNGTQVYTSTNLGISGNTGAASNGIHLHLEFNFPFTPRPIDPNSTYNNIYNLNRAAFSPAYFYYTYRLDTSNPQSIRDWVLQLSYITHLDSKDNTTAFWIEGMNDGASCLPLANSVILHYYGAQDSEQLEQIDINQFKTKTLTPSLTDNRLFEIDLSTLVPKNTPKIVYWIEAQDKTWDGIYRHAYRPWHYKLNSPPSAVCFEKRLFWPNDEPIEPREPRETYIDSFSLEDLKKNPPKPPKVKEIPKELDIYDMVYIISIVENNLWLVKSYDDFKKDKKEYLILVPQEYATEDMIAKIKNNPGLVKVMYNGKDTKKTKDNKNIVDATNAEYFKVLLSNAP